MRRKNLSESPKQFQLPDQSPSPEPAVQQSSLSKYASPPTKQDSVSPRRSLSPEMDIQPSKERVESPLYQRQSPIPSPPKARRSESPPLSK